MNNINKLRLLNNLGISELAEKCNVTSSYITKLEKGNVKISPTMMKKLKKIFNCSELEILSNESDIDIEGNDVTFANNKNISIHRWYPYIEGFSQGFVDEILDKFNKDKESIDKVICKIFKDYSQNKNVELKSRQNENNILK